MPEESQMRDRTASATDGPVADAVLWAAGAVIVVLDPQGRIAYFNKACADLSRLSLAEVYGRHVCDALIAPKGRHQMRAALAELAAGAQRCTLDAALLVDKGPGPLLAWRITRTRDSAAGRDWIVCAGMPVADRPHLREQLRRLQHLEAVGQLSGRTALEFNNLLTAILGYVDLNIAEVPEGTQFREDMTQLKAAALRAAELANQLLAVSRQHVDSERVFDLNDAVRSLAGTLQNLLDESHQLRLDLCQGELNVEAHLRTVESALMDMVGCGRDAAPRGGLLTVRTDRVSPQDEPGCPALPERTVLHAVVAVAAEVTGVPVLVSQTALDRLRATLAECNGALSVEPPAEGGVVLAGYIPLAEAVAPESEHLPEESALQRPATILLAASDEAVRVLALRVLEDSGHRVVSARSADAAIAMLRSGEPQADLLVVEPDVAGVCARDLVGQVRALRPMLKVILVQPDGVGSDGSTGDVPVLHRPFTAHGLARKVGRVLRHAGQQNKHR
jgi:two-component system cell cycle sensor histidine kinase/response regulator CckA